MSLSRRTFLSQAAAATAWAVAPPIRALGSSLTPTTKKGLAGIAPENSGLLTSWYYDWRLHPATSGMPALHPEIQFHPMCWGWRSEATMQAMAERAPGTRTDESTAQGLLAIRARKPKVLFGFNEPDQPEQSHLSPDTAIDAWTAFQGIAQELVSPSCAHPQSQWMEDFVSGVERRHLQLDSLGYHTYPSDSVDAFATHLDSFYRKYARPVWITEFAVADWTARDGHTVNRYSVDRVAEFMRGACKFLEETPWIRGYAWFPRGGKFASRDGKGPLASSVLFNDDGTLNELGKLYLSI